MMSLLKIDPLPKDDGGDGTRASPRPTPGTAPRRRPTATAAPHRGAADQTGDGRAGREAPPQTRCRRRRDGPAARPAPPRDAASRRADGDRTAGPAGTARRRRRPTPPAGGAGAAGTRLAPGTRSASARRGSPGGQGRETSREPRAQKRHGQLGGLGDADPRAGDVLERFAARGSRSGRRSATCRSRSTRCPCAWVSLPGPLQSSPAPRRERISAMPSSGSSARIRTAAPTSSGSHTALSSAWMP